MDLLRLFEETVEDLRVRSSLTSTSYDAIQAAGLMRRLLLDRQAVGPRATSELRRRGWYPREPTFSWNYAAVSGPGLQPVHAIVGAMLDPDLYRARTSRGEDRPPDRFTDATVQHGSAEDLLALPLIWDQFESPPPWIVTRDLIKHLAHAMGGVHHGQSNTPPSMLLADAIAADLPRVLWTMRALGRVVVRGYEPLVYAAILRGDFEGGGFIE
jgi:hypothetical protein